MVSQGAGAFTLDENDSKGSKGCFVKRSLAIIIAIIVIAVIVLVAIIVYYTKPKEPCDELSSLPEAEQQKKCMNVLRSSSKVSDICSGLTTPTPTPAPTPTPTPAVPLTDVRLNRTLIPTHYNIELQPYIYDGDDFGFDGSVEIWMKALEPIDVIILHINNLTIDSDSVTVKQENAGGADVAFSRWEEDRPRHFMKIHLQRPLAANRQYYVTMRYNGTLLHKDLGGMYLSEYKENNKTKYIVSTQFEVPHARRAFPCFDEPFFKATFNVTLVRKTGFSSISNMPRIDQVTRGSGWVADVYQQSVVMPTYLVAFVVSEFVYRQRVTSRGLRLRVWSRPAYIESGQYALDVTGSIINAFEEWTDITYKPPMPKLDQIAIPAFKWGAMENWGLIKYRESALLYEDAYSSMANRMRTGSIIAHELAHMWFGNLVTCDWWDNIFLNEAFATYFGDNVGLNRAEPTWNMEDYFLHVYSYILEKDGYVATQPVYVHDIKPHLEWERAFDRITYYKGGSILRMTKDFLGERTFQEGLRRYLQRYSYKTVVHENLYKELQDQAVRDQRVTWDMTKTNLSGIMDTWIEQVNYPLVTVTDLGNGRVRLDQSHFLYDPQEKMKYPSPFGEFIWDIPVTIADKGDVLNGIPKQKWMLRQKSVEVTGLAPNQWKLANLNRKGFYRVMYDNDTYDALLQQLMTDHTIIPVASRAEIVDDAFNVARAGLMEEVDALRSTQYMTQETEFIVWYPALRTRIPYYEKMFYDTPVFQQLSNYIQDLILQTYNRFEWDEQDSYTMLSRYTRALVVKEACKHLHKPCVDAALQLFHTFMGDPERNLIPSDLHEVVYCTGVAHGGAAEWDFVLEMSKKDYQGYVALEKQVLESALSCARLPSVIRKHLRYALENNSTTLFNNMAAKREAQDTVWNFMEENWDNSPNKESVLTTMAGMMSTEATMRRLKDFLTSHEYGVHTDLYKKVTKVVQKNIDWLDKNEAPIADWLSGIDSAPTSGRRKRSVPSYVETVQNIADLRDDFYTL